MCTCYCSCLCCVTNVSISSRSGQPLISKTSKEQHYHFTNSCPHRVPWKKREDCFVCCIVCGKGLIWHYHLGAYCIMHHYSSPTLIHYIKLGKLSLSVSLSLLSLVLFHVSVALNQLSCWQCYVIAVCHWLCAAVIAQVAAVQHERIL